MKSGLPDCSLCFHGNWWQSTALMTKCQTLLPTLRRHNKLIINLYGRVHLHQLPWISHPFVQSEIASKWILKLLFYYSKKKKKRIFVELSDTLLFLSASEGLCSRLQQLAGWAPAGDSKQIGAYKTRSQSNLIGMYELVWKQVIHLCTCAFKWMQRLEVPSQKEGQRSQRFVCIWLQQQARKWLGGLLITCPLIWKVLEWNRLNHT